MLVALAGGLHAVARGLSVAGAVPRPRVQATGGDGQSHPQTLCRAPYSEQTPLYENRVGPCATSQPRRGRVWRETHDIGDPQVGMPASGANLPSKKANLPTCTGAAVIETASTAPAMASKSDWIADRDVCLDIVVQFRRISVVAPAIRSPSEINLVSLSLEDFCPLRALIPAGLRAKPCGLAGVAQEQKSLLCPRSRDVEGPRFLSHRAVDIVATHWEGGGGGHDDHVVELESLHLVDCGQDPTGSASEESVNVVGPQPTLQKIGHIR